MIKKILFLVFSLFLVWLIGCNKKKEFNAHDTSECSGKTMLAKNDSTGTGSISAGDRHNNILEEYFETYPADTSGNDYGSIRTRCYRITAMYTRDAFIPEDSIPGLVNIVMAHMWASGIFKPDSTVYDHESYETGLIAGITNSAIRGAWLTITHDNSDDFEDHYAAAYTTLHSIAGLSGTQQQLNEGGLS